MDMQTIDAITKELVRRGVPATYEFPGSIAIPLDSQSQVLFGDVNQYICGDVTDFSGEYLGETVESDIPSYAVDVERVANFIADFYFDPNSRDGAGRRGRELDKKYRAAIRMLREVVESWEETAVETYTLARSFDEIVLELEMGVRFKGGADGREDKRTETENGD